MFLLRQILHRLQREKQLSDLPRPCDVFDLAGGTSTGGYVLQVDIFQVLSDDPSCQTHRDNALPVTDVHRRRHSHLYNTGGENVFAEEAWWL